MYNHIQIPSKFVKLAGDWHGGQDCVLYAISSTGNLTLGSQRPESDMTNEEWYQSLWDDLELTLYKLIKNTDDAELIEFHKYVSEVIEHEFGE